MLKNLTRMECISSMKSVGSIDACNNKFIFLTLSDELGKSSSIISNGNVEYPFVKPIQIDKSTRF